MILDLGWYPEGDPNGAFELQLVTHKDFKKLFSIETRSLNEVLDGIEKITWGVSQGILPTRDREFSIELLVPPIRLQPLKIYSGWTVRHNTFTETDPLELPPDRPEMWKSLTEDLLRLENDDHDEFRLGWEPAGDPNGDGSSYEYSKTVTRNIQLAPSKQKRKRRSLTGSNGPP
ncbi:hypothetical protein JIR001_11720 [Polycladomyces abyssicola]|uniref:Uncharacterized protein n=1 Tax=Polycladomyces abyssicola TaxID=1125966 RepID=A0A8D5ZKD6_9BACL|nr:hypothetical protein JIR001_11720 [Polycladomyces abyssicola]